MGVETGIGSALDDASVTARQVELNGKKRLGDTQSQRYYANLS